MAGKPGRGERGGTVKASSGRGLSLGIINIGTAGLFYSGGGDRRGAEPGAGASGARCGPFPGARLPPRRGHWPVPAQGARPARVEIHIAH